jgi:hypothetical protein
MPDNEKSHGDLLENTPGCKQRAEGHEKFVLIVLGGVVELKVEPLRKWNSWAARGRGRYVVGALRTRD